MKQESNRQKTMEDIDGGLHPVVAGQSQDEGRCERSLDFHISRQTQKNTGYF